MKLYVVGLGPGAPSQMTPQARAALDESVVIFGYVTYIDLIKTEYSCKEFHATAMRQEMKRCRAAFEAASSGRTVCIVCSGDAGVYGMASPLLELAPAYPDVEVIIVPGITAALSCAALLGAPLGHDFAVVSLSDRLTPWSNIEKKLKFAALADFILCLYNPASDQRPLHLQKACDILLEHLPPQRICGVVRSAGRSGESQSIMTLLELRAYPADMFTTVFIGNSATLKTGGRMVTPRGYKAL